MSVYNYKIINPKINRKKPFLDRRGFFIVPRIGKNYKYYIEASTFNPNTGDDDYYILISDICFDEQCKKCRVDDYGRLKIPVTGLIKDYLINESKNRGNFNFEYIESLDAYDVYIIE
jgi:hypothetical protein